MSMYSDDVILPITQTRLPLLFEEITKTDDYAIVPIPGDRDDVGLLGTVMFDFCDNPQYLHFLKGDDVDTVIAFFEGNPQLIDMLESDGLLATLNAVTNYFAIGGVKLQSLEPEKAKKVSIGSLTVRILQARRDLRAKILKEIGVARPKGREIYAALQAMDEAKLTLLVLQIKVANETHALNEKADAMEADLKNKPADAPKAEAPAAEPAPAAAEPEVPAPIVHECPVYRNPTLLGFVAGTVVAVGAVALVRRLMK